MTPRNFLLAALLSPVVLALASCGSRAIGDKASGTASARSAQQHFNITDHGHFDEPWAMAFEPDSGNLFITQKAGAIKFVRPDGSVGLVSNVPKVDYGGQGGLGDFAFAPDYQTSRMVYLSWAQAGTGDTRGAVVGRAKLVCEAQNSCALQGLAIIWRQFPKVSGRGHYSHRIAFSPDGKYLFIASGDRQKMQPAQDLSSNLGAIVRLNLDGSPADGNPLIGRDTSSRQIWSIGHRNILGLQFDAQGQLWDLEHGPAGGDELNRVEPAANFGWPIVSNGDHYNGEAIPDHTARPEFSAPAISWNPVIAPGGFIFYSGDLFSDWRGDAIIAGLGSNALVRVRIDGNKAQEQARYDFGQRLRAIAQGPDGAIWIIEDGKQARLRKIMPLQNQAGERADRQSGGQTDRE